MILNPSFATHHSELGQKNLSLIPINLQHLILEVFTEFSSLTMTRNIKLLNDPVADAAEIKDDRLYLFTSAKSSSSFCI